MIKYLNTTQMYEMLFLINVWWYKKMLMNIYSSLLHNFLCFLNSLLFYNETNITLKIITVQGQNANKCQNQNTQNYLILEPFGPLPNTDPI